MVLFAAPLARSPCHRTIPLAGPDVEMLPPPAANTNTGTVLTRQYEYPHTISRYRIIPSRSAACDSSVLSRRQMSAVANDSARTALRIQLRTCAKMTLRRLRHGLRAIEGMRHGLSFEVHDMSGYHAGYVVCPAPRAPTAAGPGGSSPPGSPTGALRPSRLGRPARPLRAAPRSARQVQLNAARH